MAEAQTGAAAATADPKAGAAAGAAAASTQAATTSTETKAAGTAQAASGNGTAATATSAASTEAKPYWPQDWQKQIAGEDEKELKQLSRYASPADIWKKARSLEQRMSSGELLPSLPKNPKPEELAAWRKDNGIPDKADGYDLKGITVPEHEADTMSGLLEVAHAANLHPEQTRAIAKAYLASREQEQNALEAADEEHRSSVLDTLSGEWGGKLSAYKNRIENYLSMFPESVRDSLKNARLPDGMALFNHPDVLRTIVSLSLRDVPDGVIVPGDGGDLGKSMVDRYNEIQKYRSEERGKYNKDEKVQKEERDLIDALQKHGLMDEKGNLLDGKRKAA